MPAQEQPQVTMPFSSLPGRGSAAMPAAPDVHALSLRQVHRAIAELRRGTPVVLTSPGGDLLVAAAETVSARGLAEVAAASHLAAILLLAPVRAAAILHRPVLHGDASAAPEDGVVALRLPALPSPETLRSLADPTAEQLLPETRELMPVPTQGAAAIRLAKLARLLPALVAAPATRPAPEGLLSVPAADVLAYPDAMATSLTRVAEASVPLDNAPDARILAFRGADGGIEHLAILVGDPLKAVAEGRAPLVRAHSECFTGDLLGSLRCDCGPQLRGAIGRMAQDPAGGVLLYLAQEGRGIGLVNKLRAYTLQDSGLDTLDANRALGYGADERNFMVAATMLGQLGVTKVRLLTNNPDKLAGLQACGIAVEGREAHQFDPNGVNDHYLATKARRFGHLLG